MAYARTSSLRLLPAAIILGGLFATAHAAEAPPASGGMVIHRDPTTGQLTVPPPGAIPSSGERLRAPAEAETEVPGTTPAGGWKLRVPRRFMHSMRATTGADGTVSTECVPGIPGGE